MMSQSQAFVLCGGRLLLVSIGIVSSASLQDIELPLTLEMSNRYGIPRETAFWIAADEHELPSQDGVSLPPIKCAKKQLELSSGCI